VARQRSLGGGCAGAGRGRRATPTSLCKDWFRRRAWALTAPRSQGTLFGLVNAPGVCLLSAPAVLVLRFALALGAPPWPRSLIDPVIFRTRAIALFFRELGALLFVFFSAFGALFCSAERARSHTPCGTSSYLLRWGSQIAPARRWLPFCLSRRLTRTRFRTAVLASPARCCVACGGLCGARTEHHARLIPRRSSSCAAARRRSWARAGQLCRRRDRSPSRRAVRERCTCRAPMFTSARVGARSSDPDRDQSSTRHRGRARRVRRRLTFIAIAPRSSPAPAGLRAVVGGPWEDR